MDTCEEIKALQKAIDGEQRWLLHVHAWAIAPSQEKISSLKSKICDLIREDLNRPDIVDINFGYWECEKSPTGNCAYDAHEDPSYDECLYCGQPHERK